MNFNPDRSPWNMPELNWHYGYPFSLLLMVLTTLALLYYFKRKRWLGRKRYRSVGSRQLVRRPKQRQGP